jgi:hypothetical protein
METNPNTSIQAEKYLLIRQLVELEDLNLFNQIKTILNKANPIAGYNSSGKVITQQELLARAIQSNKDIENNHVIDLDDLKKESDNW